MRTAAQILIEKIAATPGAALLRSLAGHVNMGPASAAASFVRGGQSATALDTFKPFMHAMTTGLPGGAQGNWRNMLGFASQYAERNPQAATNPAALNQFAKSWSVRRQSLAAAKNPAAMSGMQAAPRAPSPMPATIAMPQNRVGAMAPQTMVV